MKSVMDLLLYVSTSVYHVSPIQLTLLMLTKLLAQEAIEALTYKWAHVFVCIRSIAVFYSGASRIKDTLGPAILSTIERLFSSRRSKKNVFLL